MLHGVLLSALAHTHTHNCFELLIAVFHVLAGSPLISATDFHLTAFTVYLCLDLFLLLLIFSYIESAKYLSVSKHVLKIVQGISIM